MATEVKKARCNYDVPALWSPFPSLGPLWWRGSLCPSISLRLSVFNLSLCLFLFRSPHSLSLNLSQRLNPSQPLIVLLSSISFTNSPLRSCHLPHLTLQTPAISKSFALDGVVTLVDAKNILPRLREGEQGEGASEEGEEEIDEAFQQIMFSDRIVVNKVRTHEPPCACMRWYSLPLWLWLWPCCRYRCCCCRQLSGMTSLVRPTHLPHTVHPDESAGAAAAVPSKPLIFLPFSRSLRPSR